MADTSIAQHGPNGLVLTKAIDNGDSTFTPTIARYGFASTPTPQATIATYADVAGSLLDTLHTQSVAYTILNSGANSLTWQVLAANLPDFSDVQVVKAPAAVAAAGIDTYVVAAAPYRYYKVQVKDTVGASHGTATLGCITKG